MTTKNKNYGLLSRYNKKRVIEIASYKGVNPTLIKTIERGMTGTIRNCNQLQKDFKIELFSLDDNDIHSIGIMVGEDCPFEDETVKRFFITQLATITGLFFAEKEKT